MINRSLRHRSSFGTLWTAQAVSVFGSQVTLLALPLTAVLTLGATPGEMGLLTAAQFLPLLLFGLLAGVWVDRLPLRPILVGADIGRAALLGTIPLAAWLGVLSMAQLYAVGVLVGVCTVFFDVAYLSYVPALVTRADLTDANSKLESTRAVAQVSGPGIAGLLVQAVAAATAMALDAASFMVSAVLISRIRAPEPPKPRVERRSVRVELAEGLRALWRQPLLRPMALCNGTSNLFFNVGSTVLLLHLSRTLRLSPLEIGIVFAANGIGGVVGALVAGRAARRFGVGAAMIVSIASDVPVLLGFSLLAAPSSASVLLAMLGWFVVGLSSPICFVNAISLRQAVTPPPLRGRINATYRLIAWGTIPVGALIGGDLGGAIGLRQTLAVAAAGALLPPLWLLFSPVRSLRAVPDAEA